MDLGNRRDTVPGSFRDPAGFLFLRDGVLHRQVNDGYGEHYDFLMTSGLYADLASREALIPHEEVPMFQADDDGAYKILRPETIPFISFPFEWCFSQLKDAALLTLEIQERAMAFGLSLKDASAYNIQFHKGKPILIDTLSFERYLESAPWIAYRQFCQHFLAPLSLMAKTDHRLGSLSQIFLDGLPLDLASSLLPLSTRMSPGLLMHIHLHAKTQKTFARVPAHARTPASSEKTVNPGKSGGIGRLKMRKSALAGLVQSLRRAVEALEWRNHRTAWGDYYRDNSYTEASLTGKQRVIQDVVKTLNPASLWDLGANSGLFSRIASSLNIPTLSFDFDHAAVEANYGLCKQRKEEFLFPLILDLTNPSPSIGWANRERPSLLGRGPAEACMALALIHHLAISNNLPFDKIASFFKEVCRHLIIEFVPETDIQVRRLLDSRRDAFPNYNEDMFTRSFSRHFHVKECHHIVGSDRKIYLMERKQE